MHFTLSPNRKVFLAATTILLLAGAWKLGLILSGVVQFNSDEAVVALMARHILQGARPVFFYGQAYMGSLDAWLVAGLFALFGENVSLIRVVQLELYLLTILTTIWIGRAAFDSWQVGLGAGLLMAVPTVNASLYTTASLGGYGEALLLGNLQLLAVFLAARRAQEHKTIPPVLFFGWGLFAGVGLWANGLTLVYSAPSGVYLLWILFRSGPALSPKMRAASLGLALLGGMAGSAPWWLYALGQGPQNLVGELGGGAVDVEGQPWLVRTASHLVNFVLLGCTALFGLRPPWEVRWLAWPLLPFGLAFWFLASWYLVRQSMRRGPLQPGFLVLLGVATCLIAGFLFTPFGIDPSGRYFLPLTVILALSAAVTASQLVPGRGWRVALIGLVVVFQGWGTLECALRFPPGLTTQFFEPSQIDHRFDGELRQFLLKKGETRGYSNYWVTYPLAFLSSETLIFPPALPYHPDLSYTSRDNRYARYQELADRSQQTAYISTVRLPEVNAALRTRLSGVGVTWQEEQIGDYLVFYRLSRAVRPSEIGFGSDTGPVFNGEIP